MGLQRFAEWSIAFLLASITTGTSHAATDDERPSFRARNPERRTPAFVAAEEVAAAADPVAAGLVDEGEWHSLDVYREGYRREAAKADRSATVAARADSLPPFSTIAEDECQVFLLRVDERFPPSHGSFSDLLRHADSIFSGRIVAVTQGFFFGQPGTLLKVEIITEQRSSEQLPGGRHRYVYYPFAAFQIKGEPFCSRTVLSPHRPRVGERILVFNYFSPVDADKRLVHTVDEGLFFEDEAKNLVVPPPLARDPALRQIGGFDALLTATLVVR